MSSTIYYFSGTGNSLQVAKDLQAVLPDCHLASIPKAVRQESVVTHARVLGLVFPVYWLGLPVIVTRFLERLEAAPETYCFAVGTCGGVSGQAIHQVGALLAEKGLTLHAGFTVWMPGNNQTYYPPFPQVLQRFQFGRAGPKIGRIAKIIQRRGETAIKKNLWSSDLLLRVYYRRFIRKAATMDKGFWIDRDCTFCGLCERICPVQNIRCTSDTVEWQGHCEVCLACMQWCPTQAIQYKHIYWRKRRYQHPKIRVDELLETNGETQA